MPTMLRWSPEEMKWTMTCSWAWGSWGVVGVVIGILQRRGGWLELLRVEVVFGR
jgi:hypothetical protein